MRWFATLVVLIGFSYAQQTPFDEPVKSNITDPSTIIGAVQGARESIFVVAPTLRSAALVRVLGEQAQRVPVYVVVQEPAGNLAAELAQAGAQVRILPNMVEGLLLIDYAQLFAGGLVSGSGGETQYVDLASYGNQGVVQQLRGLWQAATPLGSEAEEAP